jgi:hypothetical protein
MNSLHPKLRFPPHQIPEIAAKYEYSISENELFALKPGIQERGYLKKSELAKLAFWKAPRSSGHVEGNSEEYVEEVTGFAFSARTERARVELLRVLNGVSWPTASVILHFFHKDPYPIIDYRALWSVSLDVPNQYTFNFWMVYVNFCRQLANENGVDMRTLDRALWQYSKENQ